MIFQPLSPPAAADTTEQHGHLVTQILETQKELEDDGHHQSQNSQPKKVEIVSSVIRVLFRPIHCIDHLLLFCSKRVEDSHFSVGWKFLMCVSIDRALRCAITAGHRLVCLQGSVC
jgi:hypothetical protein